MAKKYFVTGEFLNGNKYEAVVSEEDHADFIEHFMNSTDNGVTLDAGSISIVEEEVD